MRSVDDILAEAATLGLRVGTLVDTGKVCRASLWWLDGKQMLTIKPSTGSSVAAALEAALEAAKAQLPKKPLTQMAPTINEMFG